MICITQASHMSDSMENSLSCNVGVRHGENLSPILFTLYLNDLQCFDLSDRSKVAEYVLQSEDVMVF